jgi:Pentapeptide repeats (8 copies)
VANEEHLARLKEGMAAWNQWRKEHYPVLRQRCASAFQQVWGTAAPAGRQGLQTIKETSRETFARLRATSWQAIASRHWKLFLFIVAVIAVGIIWKVPQWQAASWKGLMEPKDLAKLQNDARTTLVQAFGGAVLLIGLYFTLRNFQLAQDKQITEHYTRAVEQLGSDKLEVRLGAIYALERIAKDSERDHWPIMEILTTSVRIKAPWTQERKDLDLDVQAALTVLGRRTRTYRKGETERLNLRHTDLRGAHLAEAHLEGADLTETYLEHAFLYGAHLEDAFLWHTHLEGAFLTAARLNGAILTGAHVEGAEFEGVHLEGVWGLTVEQLASVKTLYRAHLDSPLREQIQQQYPHLLEEASIRHKHRQNFRYIYG